MNKKLLRTSVIASVMAMAFTASAWAADEIVYDDANHGNSYEAAVFLTATEESNGNTGLGIKLYRGDKKNTAETQYQTEGVKYLTEAEAKKALGELYNDKYAYTVVEHSAEASFNKVLSTTIINDVKAMVEKGDNVYITGDGTDKNPYIINAVDTYANVVQHEIKDGKLVTTITHNDDTKQVVSNEVKIGDATVTVDGNPVTIEQAINNNVTNIENNATNIQNNTNEITKIKNDYVTNIYKNREDGDVWYVDQNVGGQQQTIEFKDKHITGHEMALNGDYLDSTITTNFGDTYSSYVRIGNATIDYAGDTNQESDTQEGGNSTIEQAINNNYSKIVNIENNNVTNISERQTEQVTDNYGKTYNVNYYNVTQTENGEDASTTIKDTTLVQKNLFGEGVRAIDVIVPRVITPDADGNYDAGQVAAYQDMVNNNALIGYIDQTTGVPEIVLEFQDTSGNVVQGAVDFGTLFAESLSTEAGANIEVTQKARGLGNYTISLASTLQNMDEVQITDGLVIDNNGIDMNGDKITELADGEVSETSQDAINGSQLWQEQQDRIAGDNMLGNRLDKLGTRLDKVGAGAAALAALHPMDFDPDDKLQFSAGVGNYRGETAAALGAFYRPTEKVMFSVAGTMGNGENMVNAGVTFALDRKNNVSNSRVAMAHEIQDLREQVAALTALVSQIAGKGNPLLDTVMFPDVPENHWAYDYVESLQKRGIIEGYPDGNFAGDRSMTRYEYAAMLYRALEKGFPVDGRLLKEFEAELGRIRIDRIKGTDDDANKVERVRVNDYEGRDDYGSKLAQVVADAAPVVEEEPAA